MAITERNKSLPGVEYILLTSSYAIEEFRTGAHVAEDRMQIMQQEIDKLIEKENQLLNKFGGMNGLISKINKFKADAQNLSGKGLGINFTWAYQTQMESALKKAQQDFEIYLLGYLRDKLGEDIINNLHASDLYQFLNLKEFGLTDLKVIVTEKGSTVKVAKGAKRSGGQVGSVKDNQKLAEFLLKSSSSAVYGRVEDAVKWAKKQLKMEGVDLKAYAKIEKNRLNIYPGTNWYNLTSRGGKPLTESEARANPYMVKNIDKINEQIIDDIKSSLGISGEVIDAVFEHMLGKNKFMFFVGKNEKQITGLIGEITAMVLFYDLVGHYPSVSWAAQHTGLKGTQDSADIIIWDGYGIQVKNSTEDLNSFELNSKGHSIGFSDVSFERLGNTLGFQYQPIENLYSTDLYNVEYEWNKKDGGGYSFSKGSNSNFSHIRAELENLEHEFESLMAMYAAALLYMADVRNTGKTFYSGDIGNVLYMVNLIPYRASEMLERIKNELLAGEELTAISFNANYDSVGRTIIEDINPNPHAFFSSAGTETSFGGGFNKPRFKTSYNFK